MAKAPLIPVSPSADEQPRPGEPRPGATSTSTPRVGRLEGITSIDEKVFLECEILAHSAVSRIAGQIAKEVLAAHVHVAQNPSGASASSPVPTVILVDEALASALQLFSALKLQLALFERGFNGVASSETDPTGRRSLAVPGMAVSAVTGGVEGVLDLVGLFRQDTQFLGRTVLIKETALYLEVAHALRQGGWQVIYPRLLALQANEGTQASQRDLTQLFDSVFSARNGAARRLRPLLQVVSGLEQELLDCEREFSGAVAERQEVLTQEIQDLKARLIEARKNLDPDLVLFENTDTRWNDLQRGLVTADEKSGQVPIQLLDRAAESIARFRASAPAYFLYAEAVVAGGTMRVRRSLWRTLFQGDALQFSGGAVVSYALFDGKAQVRTSRTHRSMTEFRGFPDAALPWERFNSF